MRDDDLHALTGGDAAAHDLLVAKHMQEALMPSSNRLKRLRQTHRVSVRGHYEASSVLGGDLWGVTVVDRDRFAIYLADFAGHGLPAALNTFRLHALMERMPLPHGEPDAVLTRLNLLLAGLLPVGQFATMFHGVVDVRARTLTWAGAAAPAPFLVQDRTLAPLDTEGFPLGVTRDATYRRHSVAFHPGDGLFLYSDALPEATLPRDRLLDQQGVADLLAVVLATKGSRGVVRGMTAAARRMVGTPMRDDLTMVWVQGDAISRAISRPSES